ncbi:MAG: hypothetical protein FD143_2534 [Ignavibacteria bacterium]|nr:MAG: hypothetical protein FD143_2534 [Ignavibacteria bacterium]KAF0156544.1 MAG: hypothetical protein FD188_2938 [Ignavibacteria bacterium]
MKRLKRIILGFFIFLVVGVNILLLTAENTSALPAQPFKMSFGGGSCPGTSGGDYWVSCHLPGSECSIMPCNNFNF